MKLRVTRHAEWQVDQVLASIRARSPLGAYKVGARLRDAFDLLMLHPHAGRLTDRRRVRRFVAAPYPYLIFYRVDPDAVGDSRRQACVPPATMRRRGSFDAQTAP